MKSLSSKQGFTLIEVIIVLAVIAVISAIVIPNFIKSTDSAKLKSDIQSVKAIQNAVDLYIAEFSEEPGDSTGNDTTKVFKDLFDKGYINSVNPEPQTEKASYDYTEREIKLLLHADNKAELLKMISEKDKTYVKDHDK